MAPMEPVGSLSQMAVPGVAGVGGLPDTAADGADVEGGGLAGQRRRRRGCGRRARGRSRASAWRRRGWRRARARV